MRKQTGFSLVELVMVIVIVSILAVFAAAQYPGRATFDLTSISDQLKRDIRYTQILAMGLNTNYTITLTSGSYTIAPAPFVGNATTTLPTGVTVTPQTIAFNANGTPTNGATTVTVTTSSGSRVLTLYAGTGFIDG